MLFKDLKTGYNVYMLHKGEDITVGQGKVTAISPPRIPQTPNLQTMQMMVDVTIDEGGISRTYAIPDSLSITYSGTDLVIATERDHILKEIEAMKSHAESMLADVPRQKKAIAQCEKILEEWNPAFKERRETEERFGKIETSIGNLTAMVSNLIKELKT